MFSARYWCRAKGGTRAYQMAVRGIYCVEKMPARNRPAYSRQALKCAWGCRIFGLCDLCYKANALRQLVLPMNDYFCETPEVPTVRRKPPSRLVRGAFGLGDCSKGHGFGYSCRVAVLQTNLQVPYYLAMIVENAASFHSTVVYKVNKIEL